MVWPWINRDDVGLVKKQKHHLSAGGYGEKEAGRWLMYLHTNTVTSLHSHYLKESEHTGYMKSLAATHAP